MCTVLDRTSRRGLLAVAAGGLVSAGGASAWGPLDAAKVRQRRPATMGDIERLDRKIEDVRDTVRGFTARLVNMGFGPSALPVGNDALSEVSSYPYTFITNVVPIGPGSIMGLSIGINAAYQGAAGSNYVDFAVYKNSGATSLTLRISGGYSNGAYSALLDKGDITFAPGDVLTLRAVSKVGTPFSAGGIAHSPIIWVSLG